MQPHSQVRTPKIPHLAQVARETVGRGCVGEHRIELAVKTDVADIRKSQTTNVHVCLWRDLHMSSSAICDSRMRLSTLLMNKLGTSSSFLKYQAQRRICLHVSMPSTELFAPSVMRRAPVTSEDKPTCPGESVNVSGLEPEQSTLSCSNKRRETHTLQHCALVALRNTTKSDNVDECSRALGG